jgi:hypothetical protein
LERLKIKYHSLIVYCFELIDSSLVHPRLEAIGGTSCSGTDVVEQCFSTFLCLRNPFGWKKCSRNP